jgi:hypothetical protein
MDTQDPYEPLHVYLGIPCICAVCPVTRGLIFSVFSRVEDDVE